MLHGTLLFHLNLCYSSIEVERREEVVRRCYRPLLGLLDELPWLVLAVEASGFTLEEIQRIDPKWITRLSDHISSGRVEFVGSGDAQIIGPLVPGSVNRWNQRLGRETYERLLGRAPTTALVNEMAWSQGLVDHYLQAGYERLVMEWNNPRRHHPEWDNETRYGLSRTSSPLGRSIDLAWVDALLFQKFQRAASGELELDAYVEAVMSHAGTSARHVFVYASDAEVFDFRPGRYATEPALSAADDRGVEWPRIADMLGRLDRAGLEFTTPAAFAARSDLAARPAVTLTSAADPIPVKKQPKYNVTRWALSGWDDLGLNSVCFARALRLERIDAGASEWRALCRAWSSDYRTHLTATRWKELSAERAEVLPPIAPEIPGAALSVSRVERTDGNLRIETDGVEIELDLRRGLAIRSLVFRSVGPARLIGTLPHGYFEDIDWAADFYSGHTVLEIPAQKRVTDLERVRPQVERRGDRVFVWGEVATALGALGKRVAVFADHVEIAYGLAALGKRPLGTLRTGIITLIPESFGPDLVLECANGGARERFPMREACDHAASVSTLVSASAALGATDGRLALDDGAIEVELSWCKERAAALPLLTLQPVSGKRFVRIAFSLAEIDETHRPGASLRDFELAIRARRIAA